ncbi:hypothetical protein ABZ924_26900 [Streptomyces sp. NPDC046876]|uniref:hypothetical protein n=1 Tax=Streptomyces sp. NPDC046876 TaxID=3155616 RepID=UPI0033E3D57C
MGSGFFARLGGAAGTKTAAVAAAGALAVTGAVGAGVWWAAANDTGPRLAVVQRSQSVAVAPGSEQSTLVGCQAHETPIGGGYAIDGAAFATSSYFLGDHWRAVASNPGEAAATLTVYALCINARVERQSGLDFTWQAPAFRDRDNKVTAMGDGTLIRDLTTEGPYAYAAHHPTTQPSCAGGYTPVATEFLADRTVTGKAAAPVPLEELAPRAAAPGATPTQWRVTVNPGTALSDRPFRLPRSEDVIRETRILDPQPPQANFAVGARPVCVRVKSSATATAQVAVAAGGRAEAVARCPKGTLVVGGGFAFPAPNESDGAEAPQRFLGDGFLYAAADAPARGEPTGRAVTAWHVTGVNQQKSGDLYRNSAWLEKSDRETLTGNAYFDNHGHGPDDQELRGATMPAQQPLIATAVCASFDAEPTSPSKTSLAPLHPQVPPVGTSAGPSDSAASPGAGSSGSPDAGPSASPGQSASPGASATPRASVTPGPGQSSPPPGNNSPSPRPQSPQVAISQPQQGATLRRGCEESFTGSARTRPGDRPLTDPQYTAWRIKGPNGPVALGSGASGRFLVPLLPDGTYPLVFTATDPASGLTGSAEIPIRIIGCLR